MELNLQKFAGSLTVTIMKDDNSHWTAASASPASSLAEGDTVTLTLTPASGYELDEVEVLAGGVTIEEDDGTYTFDMGASNVTLFVKAKADNIYKVVENTWVWVNGSGTKLKRNMVIEHGPNGAIVGVNCKGTAINVNADIIAALVESGALIKM